MFIRIEEKSREALSAGQVRSFVSIDLDDEHVLSRVTSIISSLSSIGGDLKPVERNNIHLTLKFLGTVSQTKLAEVKTILSHVKFELFPVEIRGAGAFPNMNRMNVIWVGIGEGWSRVQQIFEQTEKLLQEAGFPRETRPFSPHITIARVRSSRRMGEMASFLEHLSSATFGAFKADRVRLKQSVLSPSGPTYSTLFETLAQT